MDNGSEALAKLPNPNAGPAHLTVASEVATRELLRDLFDIPFLRVLAWSCDAANDLRTFIGQAEDIHAPFIEPDALKQFCIGPLTINELWRGTGKDMKLDRGPYLHLDNIFVDPKTCQITCILDWRSSCVAPLFYNSGVPRLCGNSWPVREGWVIPERPDNFESLSEDEQRRIDDDLESETLYRYYEAQVYKRASHHWTVLRQPKIPILRKPVCLVSGAWENHDLFFLREVLMTITNQWDEIFPSIPCPVSFSSEEIELQSKEEENIKGLGHMLLLFREQAILPVDGMVEPEDYDIALENSRRFKEIFIGLRKDDAEKKLFKNLWPYQESGSI
ncbi:hypothetical protein N7456_006850 [Penicillium angulare]|uniref:Aminoglycoside phosphotransferase domain-containing protein n=1 Tax=Penicillium angulare TaxID=116970 RepID=A0A9W9KCD0_9EURO|nr:hypothetical protein N7456_006850 [Penicillium angulare]